VLSLKLPFPYLGFCEALFGRFVFFLCRDTSPVPSIVSSPSDRIPWIFSGTPGCVGFFYCGHLLPHCSIPLLSPRIHRVLCFLLNYVPRIRYPDIEYSCLSTTFRLQISPSLNFLRRVEHSGPPRGRSPSFRIYFSSSALPNSSRGVTIGCRDLGNDVPLLLLSQTGILTSMNRRPQSSASPNPPCPPIVLY